MSARQLGYLGGGVLLAIVLVVLFGVPTQLWIAAAIATGVVGLIALVVVRQAQADGTDLAHRYLDRQRSARQVARVSRSTATDHASDIEVRIVRAADEAAGSPAVWLHRRGGRRVHRLHTDAGWTVQRVSTKDPDDPRKRVIGESLVFASEADAVAAANDLARGLVPSASGLSRETRLAAEAQA